MRQTSRGELNLENEEGRLVGESALVGCGNMAISLELKFEGHCSSETRQNAVPQSPKSSINKES
jgi:hypothetical protein